MSSDRESDSSGSEETDEDDSSEEKEIEDAIDEETWFFESYDFKKSTSDVDSTIFWWSQVFASGYWCAMSLLKVLSLNFF